MTLKHKIAVIALFAVCAACGYGIYWWHEASLDRIAIASLDYRGPTLDKMLKILTGDDKNSTEARQIMERLPQYEQIGIVTVLARNEMNSVRMFAIRHMRGMRDVPRVRAELARMAMEDPDETIARMASRALAGRR